MIEIHWWTLWVLLLFGATVGFVCGWVARGELRFDAFIPAYGELYELAYGLWSIFESVTQGQQRERREVWLPKAREFFKGVHRNE
jgi:hypothetical protein